MKGGVQEGITRQEGRQDSPGGIGPAFLPDVEHGEGDEFLGSHALRLARDRGVGHAQSQCARGASRAVSRNVAPRIASEGMGGTGGGPALQQECHYHKPRETGETQALTSRRQ